MDNAGNFTDWGMEKGKSIDCRELSEGTPEGEEPNNIRGTQNIDARRAPTKATAKHPPTRIRTNHKWRSRCVKLRSRCVNLRSSWFPDDPLDPQLFQCRLF